MSFTTNRYVKNAFRDCFFVIPVRCVLHLQQQIQYQPTAVCPRSALHPDMFYSRLLQFVFVYTHKIEYWFIVFGCEVNKCAVAPCCLLAPKTCNLWVLERGSRTCDSTWTWESVTRTWTHTSGFDSEVFIDNLINNLKIKLSLPVKSTLSDEETHFPVVL